MSVRTFSENDMFKAELDMITAGDFTSWNFIMRYNNRQSNDVLFLTSSENKEYCLAKAAGIVDDIYRQMDDKSALYLKQVMKEAIRYNESIISWNKTCDGRGIWRTGMEKRYQFPFHLLFKKRWWVCRLLS